MRKRLWDYAAKVGRARSKGTHDEFAPSEGMCETITVDRRGRRTSRHSRRMWRFLEPLADDVSLGLIALNGGFFRMGSVPHEGSSDETPQHGVRVAPFLIGEYPVSQEQWRAVMGTALAWRGQGPRRPVDNVSWFEAMAFCRALSARTGRFYLLPSEAQWEYACRAGTVAPFYCGDTITTDLANYRGDHTYASEPRGVYRHGTTDVGSFPPNGFGLYDMLGNVWEWCADLWHDNYSTAPDDDRPWDRGADRDYRVVRGGSWHDPPQLCRCATRLRWKAGEADDFVGFRVAMVRAGETLAALRPLHTTTMRSADSAWPQPKPPGLAPDRAGDGTGS